MKEKIFAGLVIVVQVVLAIVLVALAFYAEDNFYAPRAIDGYFYIRFMVPGVCLVVAAFFNMSYPKFEKKVYLAAYCTLLCFAVANTLGLSIYALNHFPITWLLDVVNLIIVSLITAVVCGLFSFLFVVCMGRAGKVKLAPDVEKED